MNFPIRSLVSVALIFLVSSCGEEIVASAGEPPAPPTLPGKTLVVDHGDLSRMVERRSVRVLVPFEPPFFFFDQAGPTGITFEMFREYGQFLEEQEGLRAGDITIVYVPCELDAVIPWLTAGYGDIAAAALTITPEREQAVAFTDPLAEGISEILVTSDAASELDGLQDLAGREVWVTAGSSYLQHLLELSAELVAQGHDPIEVRQASGALSSEDLLEMVNAGILDLMVCDDYKAELWAEVLPDLQLRPDLSVHSGGAIAWALRPGNSELRQSLNGFVGQAKQGTLLGNILIKRYFRPSKLVEDPGDAEAAARIDRYAGWLRELCVEYDFDWLRVAAQCFQESGLDPNAVSSSGAVGLMQLLPSTGEDMGCEDLYDPEQNLRAGVRYLDWLRTNFFADPELDEVERVDFILAAYNAGPGNVRKWRKLAPQRGLDPNRWRDNVERLALEDVGIQPIRYVDNIEKYYVAYSLASELAAERERLNPDGR